MNDIENFEKERADRIKLFRNRDDLKKIAYDFQHETVKEGYLYNFDGLGLPIIQFPTDIIALQEIIFKVKPDLIIETGIARGGSIIFSSSMMALLDFIDNKENREKIDRRVIGIDIDIRKHNKVRIENHPLFPYIKLVEGSSIDKSTFDKVKSLSHGYKNVMVLLDSNHSHQHVLSELNLYSNLVSKNSYLIVYDTIVELSPKDYYKNRPWGNGDSPMTATKEFLEKSNDFMVDETIPDKILITVSPGGFLKRIK